MGSNVYISFLDISKVFDMVWRKGFMCKLYKFNIRGKIWNIIDDCY